MRYTRLQRNESEPFITVYEYIEYHRPEITTDIICLIYNIKKAWPNKYAGNYKNFAHIMTERPKPGRGGLLPGEGDEALG